MVSVPHMLSGISIALLVIYGADVMVGGGGAGDGFLPLDGMTRGVGFGLPPIVLSFVAFVFSKKPPFMGLGIMLAVTGALIIAGGTMIVSMADESAESQRAMSESYLMGAVGAAIVIMGAIKIVKSLRSH